MLHFFNNVLSPVHIQPTNERKFIINIVYARHFFLSEMKKRVLKNFLFCRKNYIFVFSIKIYEIEQAEKH